MKRSLTCIGALALLSACSAPADEVAPESVALVTLAAVATQAVGDTVTLYGVADGGPGGRASLVAPIEARLVAIDTPVGSAVRQGQSILRFSPGPTAALEIAKARNDAQVANAAYARALRMRGDGLMSDADVETTRAAQASANAAVHSLAGRSLVLKAPIAGHVKAITAVPGDIVAGGTTVGSVSGNGAARARFGIDPTLVRNLKAGARVILSRAGGMDSIGSTIVTVDPVVDAQSKLASVYAALPASSPIRPGETLTGRVALSASASFLAIPYGALLDDAGQPYVFVVAKGIANRRDIVTGPTDGDRVAVIRGLAAGDRVVVQGGTALEDGMKVRLK